MATLVLKSLSILLGLFFLFVGFLKLSCFISKELHRDIRKDYVKYAKVFPLAQTFGMKIPAKWYRRVIGSIEVLCGAILVFLPKAFMKKLANIILLMTMLLCVYSQYTSGDIFERTAPSMVFCFMLIGRLVIEWQYNRRITLESNNAEIKTSKQD